MVAARTEGRPQNGLLRRDLNLLVIRKNVECCQRNMVAFVGVIIASRRISPELSEKLNLNDKVI